MKIEESEFWVDDEDLFPPWCIALIVFAAIVFLVTGAFQWACWICGWIRSLF